MLLTALFLSLVGLALGLLGAGGSAIAVPVLVYIARMDAHHAIAFSLVLIGLVSLLGTVLNARAGTVRWSWAASFAIPGVAGSWLGSSVSHYFSHRGLLLAFGVLLAAIAVRMLLEHKLPLTTHHAPHGRPLVIAAGFAIGILTGMLGVGGGFVIVPAMIYLARLGMREAIGSSLAVISVNSLVGFARHSQFTTPPLGNLSVLLAFAAAGMGAGTWLSHHTHPERLRYWFAWFLLALAAFLVVENLLGLI